MDSTDPEDDQGLIRAADILAEAAKRAGPTKLQKLETAFGLNHAPNTPLWCIELRSMLRPCTGTRFDPCHVWYSNGLVQVELQCFFKAAKEKLEPNPITFEALAEVCSWDWKFPGEAHLENMRGKASRMFTEKHISQEAGYPRLSAAEALVAPHIVLYFVERIVCKAGDRVTRALKREADSLRAMCVAAIAVQEARSLELFLV